MIRSLIKIKLSSFIVGGLSSDYDPLVIAITTELGNEALTVDEIQSLLFE